MFVGRPPLGLPNLRIAMPVLLSFYGQIVLLAVIAAALLTLIAPPLASDMLRRISMSIVLFILGLMVAPGSASTRLIGLIRLPLSMICLLASLAVLLAPAAATHLLAKVAGLAVVCCIAVF